MKLSRTLLLISLAFASIAARADVAFDFYASNVVILQAKNIQKEIGLTEAQRKTMNDIANVDRPKRAAVLQELQKEAEAAQKAGKQYQPDYARIRPLDEALKKNVLGVLKPEQLKRLRELTVQQAGMTALLDERVAKEAGVPSATVAKLRTVFASGAQRAEEAKRKVQKKIFDIYSKKKPKNDAEGKQLQQEALAKYGKEVSPLLASIQSDVRTKLSALLTAAQKEGLKRLEGRMLHN